MEVWKCSKSIHRRPHSSSVTNRFRRADWRQLLPGRSDGVLPHQGGCENDSGGREPVLLLYSGLGIWYNQFNKHEFDGGITMKTFILDGNNFSNMEGFYCEIDKLLTKNLKWKTGHNLNAFNDLLRGGFNVHEYNEPITIRWINYAKSKKDLGDEMVLIILEIMLDCDDSDHNVKVELVR